MLSHKYVTMICLQCRFRVRLIKKTVQNSMCTCANPNKLSTDVGHPYDE